MLEKKNQFLQQLQQIQLLELDQEVVQAQMESFFRLEQGDNLVKKLNIEVVLRDGVVEEIRGKFKLRSKTSLYVALLSNC